MSTMNIRDYGQDTEMAKQFFKEFSFMDEENKVVQKYELLLRDVANRKLEHVFVDLKDLEQFNSDLAEQVKRNTMRYVDIFNSAMDEIVPTLKTDEKQLDQDCMDIFIEQRLFVAERNRRTQTGSSQVAGQSGGAPGRTTLVVNENKYPPGLIRRAEVSFKPNSLEPVPIRSVQAEHVGKLITIRGIVTRTTDVRPKASILTYTCDQCGCESFQPVSGFEFTPLFECTSSICQASKTPGRVQMQTRGSKFIKSQEIKLQEHSDQVPTGHIPRGITIIANGELTRQCAPGDHIAISGVFLTIEKSAYRARTGGLALDTYIEAHYITKMNKTENEELNDSIMSMEEALKILEECKEKGISFLTQMSSSLAPEIYGHEELKKALLLLLVGGVDCSPRGMKIRGNINICLMGDPGVAKSQLLGFINRVAPRSQYTTGRGSSGVGLTAAVLKDPITDELVLEGGALVLADEGICCIDEFDKMMDADRTAIHEVMEQQTVSIAKAGIMTTLNARVSILAAANPVYGRYNLKKTITENLDLPPALLSRFDLLWLIRDKARYENDGQLAQHVTYVHSHPNEHPPNRVAPIDMRTMRRYINLCKTVNPSVPKSLSGRLCQIYLDIRKSTRPEYMNENLPERRESMFTSPRSLLAIIRLATAFARLRISDFVDERDIDQAVNIYNSSRMSLEKDREGGQQPDRNLLSLIKKLSMKLGSQTVPLDDIYKQAKKQKFSVEEIARVLAQLDEYDCIERTDTDVVLIG